MDRLELFATPVTVLDLPDADALNRDLAAMLLAEQQASAGFQASNVGGWHSLPDLSQRPVACLQALMRAIVAHVGELVRTLAAASAQAVPPFRFGVQAWAMIMRDGDYATLHDHGDAHWSCVYYVDAGDADLARHELSGVLVFLDPRRGGRPIPGLAMSASTFTVAPRTGTLVVFPGYLQHYVHAYRGDRPRISVSANLVMDFAPPSTRG